MIILSVELICINYLVVYLFVYVMFNHFYVDNTKLLQRRPSITFNNQLE